MYNEYNNIIIIISYFLRRNYLSVPIKAHATTFISMINGVRDYLATIFCGPLCSTQQMLR